MTLNVSILTYLPPHVAARNSRCLRIANALTDLLLGQRGDEK